MTPEQLAAYLGAGVSYGASDIHFKVGAPPGYRVHGALAHLKADNLTEADILELCAHIVQAPEKLAELEEHDASLLVNGVGRFRVHIYRQRGSLAVVLRLIPITVPTLDELGLPPVLKDISGYERGLALITGPTGSGKSSTLAAIVDHINRNRRAHVLTIEDPIEFVHHDVQGSISQREVGADTRSYAAAMRTAIRQDPDVIVLGELGDAATLDQALKAAETGHMVYAAVHATNALKTVAHLVGLVPAADQPMIRYRLADNLRAIVSQRLVRRADGAGRVAAAEILVVTLAAQECIASAERVGGLKQIIERTRDQGMQSFDQHLAELYKAKKIRIDTAKEHASNPSDFERALMFE